MTPTDGGLMAMIIQFAPIIAIGVMGYFLLVRPQMKQAKAHREMVAGMKRNDTVVLSNGMIGKVTRVENDEAMVEIAQGVNVRVVKAMITQVRDRTGVAANDTKQVSKA
ncbi:preprotein translocase subunit YajC [Brevundimonas sp.]|uniref:preprotein translocase subunit YajC n=1 Tax=Brevundimonas sp. TaxID=1871086 RepID=UPI002D726B0D|nr:preprotein translocase subunit YajC [Brevundimonas sp.]HYD26106.1 preprotein translocase subunit YajC [Brevundimonas sp.]